MGVRDWESRECERVPATKKTRVWSALENWNEMLPLAGERGSRTGGKVGGFPSQRMGSDGVANTISPVAPTESTAQAIE